MNVIDSLIDKNQSFLIYFDQNHLIDSLTKINVTTKKSIFYWSISTTRRLNFRRRNLSAEGKV